MENRIVISIIGDIFIILGRIVLVVGTALRAILIIWIAFWTIYTLTYDGDPHLGDFATLVLVGVVAFFLGRRHERTRRVKTNKGH